MWSRGGRVVGGRRRGGGGGGGGGMSLSGGGGKGACATCTGFSKGVFDKALQTKQFSNFSVLQVQGYEYFLSFQNVFNIVQGLCSRALIPLSDGVRLPDGAR
jgi:hypothetical protein